MKFLPRNSKITGFIQNSFFFYQIAYVFENWFFFFFKRYEPLRFPFFELLRKRNSLLFYFHIVKNKLEVDSFFSIKIRFLIKQFEYFFKSKFFENRLKIKFFNFNFSITKINVWFFFFILQRFFFKRYYRFLSFVFFKKNLNFNFIKLNFIFFIFLKFAKHLLITLDLGKFSDWLLFNKVVFKLTNYKLVEKKTDLNYTARMTIKDFKKRKKTYLKSVYNKYKINYAPLSNWLVSSSTKLTKDVIKKGLKTYRSIYWVRIKDFFFKQFQNNLVLEPKGLTSSIQYSDSSMNKYIGYRNLKKFNFFFLRKNKIFNKSRYSRNRQLYRTGFYWCLWVNILVVYLLFFIFYRFTFNFGYFWWGIMFLFYSFIFSKVCKYNFYNIFTLLKEFWLLAGWFGHIQKDVWSNIRFWLNPIFSNWARTMGAYEHFNVDSLLLLQEKKLFDKYSFKFVLYFLWKEYFLKHTWIHTLWVPAPDNDTSFLRYKSILHILDQLLHLGRIA